MAGYQAGRSDRPMRRISRAETVYEVDMQGAGEVSAANGPRGRARSGRGERGGVCLSTRYAMTMPEGVETRNFIGYGPAMTAALHLGFPVLSSARRQSYSCVRCSFVAEYRRQLGCATS